MFLMEYPQQPMKTSRLETQTTGFVYVYSYKHGSKSKQKKMKNFTGSQVEY